MQCLYPIRYTFWEALRPLMWSVVNYGLTESDFIFAAKVDNDDNYTMLTELA